MLLYALAVFHGMTLISPLGMSAIWISNGVLISGFLLLNRRAIFVFGLGCFFLNALASLSLGFPLARVASLTVFSFTEAAAAAALARLALGRNPDFADPKRLFTYVLTAASPACILSASLVAGASRMHHLPLPDTAAEQWLRSHLVGDAVIPPAMIVLLQFRRYRLMERPALELVAAMCAIALAGIGLFLAPIPAALIALVLPMTIFAGFRYGPVGAAVSSLLVAGVASLSMVRMIHPTVGFDLHSQVVLIQVFTGLSLLTSLPAAGAVANHARMRSLLRRRTETARAARRRADAAADAKGEFLANMSHEIRTPLNGVLGLAEALSRTELSASQRELLKMILSSGKTLNALLSDALDLARADSGALQLASEPFDVAETVGQAAFLFESNAREKGLAFKVGFDVAEPGAAMGDALRIRQVVSNLISNAVKFTAQGSVTVQVSLQPRIDGRLDFEASVRDTGVGFDEAVRAKLFNRFEQGDNSVTRRFGGSGLGLAIAQRLAQMMGGTIVCESAPGRGSTFSLRLVLAPACPAAAGVTEPEGWRPDRRLKVLLAEDHPVNQRVIRMMLADTAELAVVGDGRAAIEALETADFDLVLMDTHMPVMDGLAATRTIRETEARSGRSRTPIISLTADALPEQVQAALAAGADRHLAKPITAEALFAAIEAALAQGSDGGALAEAS